VALLVFMAGAGVVWSDGLRNPPEGALVLGKAGARLVYVDDASAAAHNPANVTAITNHMASASATFVYGKKTVRPDSGGSVTSDDPWAILPNIFGAWRINDDDLAAALAITTPYGRSTTFSKNSVLRYSSPYFTELITVNANPSLAYKVNEQVSVAAGFSILYADLEQNQVYPWSMATGVAGLPDGELRVDSDGVGYGYNLAMTWNISERQRAALTYRSSSKVNFEGDMRVSGIPGPLPGITPRSDFDTSITFPAVLALGYGVQVTDALRLEANVEWVQHSLFKRLTLDADNNTALLPSDTIPADWDDNWTYGIGADYALNDAWTLRAGVIYIETPVPSDTMIPALSENDEWVFSIGFGYVRNQHRLDFAYGYGLFSDRKVKDNVNPALNGTYAFDAHIVGVSYGLNF